MKKVLITGSSSYVGVNIKKWFLKYPSEYDVDSISQRNTDWLNADFSIYNTIVHVSGFAHRKETNNNVNQYYDINRDLAYITAKKAKQEGVKHFLFFSSMSVYGIDTGEINLQTPLRPKSHYGKSKLQAENLINKLKNEDFKVAILRPPMIYGKGCKGNYSKLAKLSLLTPIFPSLDNKRSMLYVDHLSEFVRIIVNGEYQGVFYPQNKEYISTKKLVKAIAENNGKKINITNIFNPLIRILKINIFMKLFGDLTYEKSMSELDIPYNMYSFYNTISITERKD